MLQETCAISSDVSVLRRLFAAAVTLHRDTPRYWEIVASNISAVRWLSSFVWNTVMCDETKYGSCEKSSYTT